MIAIIITQVIKDLNPDLFKNYEVGSIRQLSSIPKSFYSPTYFVGHRTDGYQTLIDIHEADGFFDVIQPIILDTQKRGVIFFDVDKFTYTVIDKTQQELDDEAQRAEDSDTSSNKHQQYKSDGIRDFDRAFALIHRRFDNGTITGTQAKALAEELYPSLEPLYKGQWRLVKIYLDAETPPSNTKLLAIFNLIKNKVDTYVSENY